jgi:hypothetical protein
MLHGYHHDEPDGRLEFASGAHLAQRLADGRAYLEDLLGTTIRVFVPPRNAIGRRDCALLPVAGLHLGGAGGSARAGLSCRLRRGRSGLTAPLASEWRIGCALAADPETIARLLGMPSRLYQEPNTEAVFERALTMRRFCLATHYWSKPPQPIRGRTSRR